MIMKEICCWGRYQLGLEYKTKNQMKREEVDRMDIDILPNGDGALAINFKFGEIQSL